MKDKQNLARQIIQRLCQHGVDAYIAGGAARDYFDGQTPQDFDVVTQASYDTVKELFKDRKVKVVGTTFKVCMVDGIEVATYRKALPKDSSFENLEYEPASSLSDDLSRRDLTINALAFCPYSGDVVDIFGGLSDLKNKIIRFTGNPKDRIFEDPCRILRACRFYAKLEGRFDPETLAAMQKYHDLVKQHVTPERIRLEIVKALGYRKPSLFFKALYRIDVLKEIFPGLNACYGHDGGPFHGETIFEHASMVGDKLPANKPKLRLAGYLHDIGKPVVAAYDHGKLTFIEHEKIGVQMVETELKTLKFSNKEIDYIGNLVRFHMRTFKQLPSAKAIRKLLRQFSQYNVYWKDWFVLVLADKQANLKAQPYSKEVIGQMALDFHRQIKPAHGSRVVKLTDLKVNGHDVKQLLNLKAGPEIGTILNDLFEKVLEDPDLNQREILLEMIRAFPVD